MSDTVQEIRSVLKASVDSTRVVTFFKTGAGEYAEHDQFMDISTPTLRKIAKTFASLALEELVLFLRSPINEERLMALIILTNQYKRACDPSKEMLYQFYQDNLMYVNNWNLVDTSAHLIIGAHLWDKERPILETLAQSKNMWKRRIAIVSTWYFIRKKDVEWTFKIAQMLQKDSHDLIHKAVGWMLREAGKRSQPELVHFLEQHMYRMPRTMLRYAIEKFPEDMRKKYLHSKTRRTPQNAYFL